MEICRFGCPDHCQSPAEYVAREQLEVSTSLNQKKRQISPNPNLRNPIIHTTLKGYADTKPNCMRVINSIKAELQSTVDALPATWI